MGTLWQDRRMEMKKEIAIAVAACGMLFASMGAMCAEASFLGDVLGSVGHSFGSTSHRTPPPKPVRAERWAEVYSTEKYTIYIDTSTMKINRHQNGQTGQVYGWFKRVYTPEGSQWLGETSKGKVAPGVIAYSRYQAKYREKASYRYETHYYDAAGHEVCGGGLADVYGDEASFGNYEPETMNEQIRDVLFTYF